MHAKIKFLVLISAVSAALLFNPAESYAYTLSTGAVVDSANLSPPRNSGNGAAAEKWCKDEGKRLPTIIELREMYKYRDRIGGFTKGFDAGGWPYWSERATHNKDGKDYGYRIIFGNGSEEHQEVEQGTFVRKFGEQGEEQYRPFWIKSGFGGYVRCVK